MEFLNTLVSWGNTLTWGGIGGFWWLGTLIAVLVPVGVYFTVKTRFIQVRGFRHMMHVLRHSNSAAHEGGVTSFQAFATSAAARVGTGNIAGVAVAITAGGPGAVFWMWMVGLVGMCTSMVENTLGQAFKEVDQDERTFRGGPSFYIKKGLATKWHWLAPVFSILLIISFGFVFNSIQSNSLVDSVNHAWGIDPMFVGITVALVSSFIVVGGIKSIGKFAEIAVPVMAGFYLVVAVAVVLINVDKLWDVLSLIINSAFGLHEAGAGALGAVIANGVKRGLFSNEAGMGSSPNVGAAADVKHPVVQGYVQMASVFLDTMVICTCTAAIILIAGIETSGVGGVTITQQALASEVGSWGSQFIAIALMFFAFTSMIANYYYAETNVYYLTHRHSAIVVYRILYVLFILFGAWVADEGSSDSFAMLWNLADMSMGLMATVNVLAITLLSGVAFKIIGDYEQQREAGVEEPIFKAADHDIKGIDKEVWK